MNSVQVLARIEKKLLDCLMWYRTILKSENDFHVPLFTRIRCALHGFSANEYIWFDLAHNDYRAYISDYTRLRS